MTMKTSIWAKFDVLNEYYAIYIHIHPAHMQHKTPSNDVANVYVHCRIILNMNCAHMTELLQIISVYYLKTLLILCIYSTSL